MKTKHNIFLSNATQRNTTQHNAMPTVLAFTGLAGAGKDTAANYLIEKHGYQKMSFAATLKDAIAVIFGWRRDLLEGITDESRKWRDEKDEWWSKRLNMYISPRKVLQIWGTELCRQHFHQDIWIASLERQLSQLPEEAKIVITDCRFENEAAIIRSIGGRVIHIHRSFTASDIGHISEKGVGVGSNDIVIENNDSVIILYKKIFSIIKNELENNEN
jgi:hypothetical protein